MSQDYVRIISLYQHCDYSIRGAVHQEGHIPRRLLSSGRSPKSACILVCLHVAANFSKSRGYVSSGRTRVWAAHGRVSMGVVSSICTVQRALASHAKGRRPKPTIFPHTKSNTNDLPLVCDMIYNGSHRNTHNSQRWNILGLTLVSFRERTDVLGSRNSCFDFAPGCLGELNKQGIAGTDWNEYGLHCSR